MSDMPTRFKRRLTLALTCCRKPERGRSVATVLVVKGAFVYFFALDLLGLPGRPMPQHGVAYGQKLVPTGRQGHFLALPRGEQPLVKGFDPWVAARGDEGSHRHDGAHMRTASPPGAPAPQGATGTMERGHTDQRRDLLAIAGAQRWECQQQGAGTHGANARGTLQAIVVFPPQRAAPQYRLEGVVPRGETRIEPGNRGRHVLREARARPRQAVLRRRTHADQWRAAPKKGAQFLRLGVRQRPRCRAHHVGHMGQGAGISRIRFRQLARGPGKIPGLPWMHDDHWQACRGHGAGHQAL